MVVTRELLKAEIDRIDDKHLEELYRLVRVLETPTVEEHDENWREFIDATYGCMSDAPIEAHPQSQQVSPSSQGGHV